MSKGFSRRKRPNPMRKLGLALAIASLSASAAFAQSQPASAGDSRSEATASSTNAKPAPADEKTTSTLQDAQNPVANVISVPFQNNSYLNYGPNRLTSNVLVVQPVIPISISDDWNLIR